MLKKQIREIYFILLGDEVCFMRDNANKVTTSLDEANTRLIHLKAAYPVLEYKLESIILPQVDEEGLLTEKGYIERICKSCSRYGQCVSGELLGECYDKDTAKVQKFLDNVKCQKEKTEILEAADKALQAENDYANYRIKWDEYHTIKNEYRNIKKVLCEGS